MEQANAALVTLLAEEDGAEEEAAGPVILEVPRELEGRGGPCAAGLIPWVQQTTDRWLYGLVSGSGRRVKGSERERREGMAGREEGEREERMLQEGKGREGKEACL